MSSRRPSTPARKNRRAPKRPRAAAPASAPLPKVMYTVSAALACDDSWRGDRTEYDPATSPPPFTAGPNTYVRIALYKTRRAALSHARRLRDALYLYRRYQRALCLVDLPDAIHASAEIADVRNSIDDVERRLLALLPPRTDRVQCNVKNPLYVHAVYRCPNGTIFTDHAEAVI